MSDVILMHHPDAGFARATERAFRLAHEPKGWKRVNPDKVTKSELEAAADQLGEPVPSGTKAEIASALAGDTDDNDD